MEDSRGLCQRREGAIGLFRLALLLGRGHGTARLIRVFSRMRRLLAASLVLLTCIALPRAALSAEWATFADGRGTSVQYPRDVFSVPGPEGTPAGPVLQSADGRSRLHVFTLANERRASPAEFIRRAVTHDNERLSYKRVTGRFLVFSDARDDLILYRRCNFAGTAIHCFDIRYPRGEKRAFDAVVTRMSYSLTRR